MLLAISDAVQIAYATLAASVVIAFIPVVVIVVRDHLDRKAREEAKKELVAMAAAVSKIQVQTNSLTEKLVNETDKSARAEGALTESRRAEKVADDKVVALALVDAKKEENAVIQHLGPTTTGTVAGDIAAVEKAVVEAVTDVKEKR